MEHVTASVSCSVCPRILIPPFCPFSLIEHFNSWYSQQGSLRRDSAGNGPVICKIFPYIILFGITFCAVSRLQGIFVHLQLVGWRNAVVSCWVRDVRGEWLMCVNCVLHGCLLLYVLEWSGANLVHVYGVHYSPLLLSDYCTNSHIFLCSAALRCFGTVW